MQRVASETYPEPLTDMHTEITRRALLEIIPKLPAAASVLDVGCGQGPALRIFREKQIDAIGITLNEEDVKACQAIGLNVLCMDQNALEFPDGSFDLVWARHVLEHSIAPYFTLNEFNRVLKPGGLLYVEVPAPETACCHELNKNHYAVMGDRAWYALITRSGFEVEKSLQWKFEVPAGPDVYYSFECKKV
jgi:SAM-dependent methyltransferase